MKLSLVRRILIGFLGLYLLGLLHASITLFQSEGKIEGETSRRPVRHTAPLKRRHGAMHPTMSQTIGNASNHSFPKNASENIYGRFYGRKRRGRTSRREQKIKEKKTWLETAEQKELLLPKPIFVMGFPKAGTSSIFTFFQRQGLKSQHWYCCQPQSDPQDGGPLLMAGCIMRNLSRKNRTLLEGCGDFDLYSEINGPRRKWQDPKTSRDGFQLEDGTLDFDGPGPRIFFPQHFYLREIHQEYPNATWILNHRPIENWMKSVMAWGDDLAQQFANEYYMKNELGRLPSNDMEMKEFLETIYIQHHNLIREFVRDHPTHALVEVNITDQAAGEVLAEAFGLDPEKWTHRNKNFKYLLHWRRAPYYTFVGSSVWWVLLFATTFYLRWTLRNE